MPLTKLPEVALFVVLLSLTVGLEAVPQQTPLAVMAAPPLEVMLPPEAAVVPVTLVTETVAIVGAAAPEVRLIWAP